MKLADDSVVRAPRALIDGKLDINIGVRPEKIRLRAPGEVDSTPAGHNQMHGVVRDASYIGVSTQYQVEARGGARLTVYEQNVERATRAELWSRGEEVLLTWSPDHSFVVVDSTSPTSTGATAEDPDEPDAVASAGPIPTPATPLEEIP